MEAREILPDPTIYPERPEVWHYRKLLVGDWLIYQPTPDDPEDSAHCLSLGEVANEQQAKAIVARLNSAEGQQHGREQREIAQSNGGLIEALDTWVDAIAEGRYRVRMRQYDDLGRIEEQIERALDVLTARASDVADRRAAEREGQP